MSAHLGPAFASPDELAEAHHRRVFDEFAEILAHDDDAFQLVADAIADSRDKGFRHVRDRDSADVLNDVIAALRKFAVRVNTGHAPADDLGVSANRS